MAEAYRLVEVILTPQLSRFYLAKGTTAPFLGNDFDGPFDNPLSAQNWFNVCRQPHRLDMNLIQVQHHQEKAALWGRRDYLFHLRFRLPLDEFTERIDSGLLNTPEGIALRDALDFNFLALDNAIEKQSLSWHRGKMRCLGRERQPGQDPHVLLSVEIYLEYDGPKLAQKEELPFFESRTIPQATIPFMGITGLKCEVYRPY